MAYVPVWSEDDIAFAEKLWAEGLTASQISARLLADRGLVRSRNSIMGMTNRLRTRFPRRGPSPAAKTRPPRKAFVWTEDQITFAAELWAKHQASNRIADLLKARFGISVSHSTVCTLAAHHPDRFAHRGRGGLQGLRITNAGIIAARREAGDDYQAPATTAEARAYDTTSRRLPLADLQWRDCRFPVNDAARGETHLFCGAPTISSTRWCQHHLMRVKGSGTEGERKADRDLIFEAKRAA